MVGASPIALPVTMLSSALGSTVPASVVLVEKVEPDAASDPIATLFPAVGSEVKLKAPMLLAIAVVERIVFSFSAIAFRTRTGTVFALGYSLLRYDAVAIEMGLQAQATTPVTSKSMSRL